MVLRWKASGRVGQSGEGGAQSRLVQQSRAPIPALQGLCQLPVPVGALVGSSPEQ